MKIAVGQILQETNSFSPRPCTMADFEEGGLYLGDEILRKMKGTGEIGGLMSVVEREAPQAQLVPIIKATAMPGGMITEDTLKYLRTTLVDGLKRSLPVDGVFLSLHGAAASDKIRDVDGYFTASVREVVGPRVPIVLTLDHHANVTRLMTESADVMTAYHVQPHDPLETGQRGAQDPPVASARHDSSHRFLAEDTHGQPRRPHADRRMADDGVVRPSEGDGETGEGDQRSHVPRQSLAGHPGDGLGCCRGDGW